MRFQRASISFPVRDRNCGNRSASSGGAAVGGGSNSAIRCCTLARIAGPWPCNTSSSGSPSRIRRAYSSALFRAPCAIPSPTPLSALVSSAGAGALSPNGETVGAGEVGPAGGDGGPFGGTCPDAIRPVARFTSSLNSKTRFFCRSCMAFHSTRRCLFTSAQMSLVDAPAAKKASCLARQ